MIIITGAAGFIGSCLAGELNRTGRGDLVLVDTFSVENKKPNWQDKSYLHLVERAQLWEWLSGRESEVEMCYHLGARTDTAELDWEIFERLNLGYSKKVWNWCTRWQVPLVYASSAATYGDGTQGFVDDHDWVERLRPLNPYGESKNEFDRWALAQEETPPHWAGLKFFNVYGPNEYHKGRMASVVLHAFRQIRETGKMRLFRSHRAEVADGHQSRDFIYVKDVLRIIRFLGEQGANGLYNVGTGQARTFLDLTRAVFSALGLPEKIEFIDTPEDIRETYQYFTEADTRKLRQQGYQGPFFSLEAGIKEYVENYLREGLVF